MKNDKREINNMQNNGQMIPDYGNLESVDLTAPIPADETGRQYYFMAKARQHVAALAEKLGRRPTCCVTTFGCQMNARDSEKLVGILEIVGYEITEDENSDFVIYNTCTVRSA